MGELIFAVVILLSGVVGFIGLGYMVFSPPTAPKGLSDRRDLRNDRVFRVCGAAGARGKTRPKPKQPRGTPELSSQRPRSTYFWIFPEAVLGSSFTNSISRGCL
jgi:hypothetical protein